MKSVLGLFLVVVLAGGCSGSTVIHSGSPAPEGQELGAVEPVAEGGQGVVSRREAVELLVATSSRGRIARAIADLKGLGLWGELTRHLERLRLRARPGRANVPRDAHLADSLYRSAEGGLAPAPPEMDQFWTMILAHELAHCRDRHRSEKVALRVEARVLDLLRLR
jgi:hypothetical protein